MYHNLANLPPSSLAKEVLTLQLENPTLPSIINDLNEHPEQLGIEDLTTVSKWVLKKRVKKYIRKKCHMELMELVRKNKKIDPREYEEEPFEKRSYLSTMKLTDVRMRMRISCGMISQIKGNFKQK